MSPGGVKKVKIKFTSHKSMISWIFGDDKCFLVFFLTHSPKSLWNLVNLPLIGISLQLQGNQAIEHSTKAAKCWKLTYWLKVWWSSPGRGRALWTAGHPEPSAGRAAAAPHHCDTPASSASEPGCTQPPSATGPPPADAARARIGSCRHDGHTKQNIYSKNDESSSNLIMFINIFEDNGGFCGGFGETREQETAVISLYEYQESDATILTAGREKKWKCTLKIQLYTLSF